MKFYIIKPSKEEYVEYIKKSEFEINDDIVNSINDDITIPYFGVLSDDISKKIVCVGHTADPYNNGIVTLYECKTLDNYQNKGYFKELLNYIINDLEQNNKSIITLGVDESNIKNQEMYKRWGFEIREGITSEWEYPDGRIETILWFKKDLNKKKTNRL